MVREPTRILLADDHNLVRRGLAIMITEQPSYQVVGEASDGLEAIRLAKELTPDLVLMDIHMPKCNGIEATRRITQEMPQVRVIMLTVSEDDADVYQAIKNGALGYLPKDVEPDEFFAMLDYAQNGGAALSPTLMARVLNKFQHPEKDRTSLNSLTPREMQVLEQVVAGLNNSEIGAALFISEHTVKIHVRNILRKLQVNNRIQAAALAVRQGLVPPE